MKKVISLLIVVFFVTGCTVVNRVTNNEIVNGSGTMETRSYDFEKFDGVSISHSFEATIEYGDVFSVELTMDDNLFQYVEVANKGMRLYLDVKPGYTFQDATMRCTITMPSIKRINMSGASSAYISGLPKSDTVTVEISGASNLEGELFGKTLKTNVSGASNIHLSGEFENGELNVSGASFLGLEELVFNKLKLQVSGTTTANVYVTDDLTVEASGLTSVNYKGTPKISQSVSGMSSVNQIQ